MDSLEDAVDGLSARDAEKLKAKLERRLQRCAIDGQDGAFAVSITWTRTGGGQHKATLLMCPACLEHHRLPELRAEA
jgi:hypothetical protein